VSKLVRIQQSGQNSQVAELVRRNGNLRYQGNKIVLDTET